MRTKPPIELDDARGRSLATEEFLHYLHRSSELLNADQIDDAQESLERAFHVRSDDAAGQATLALVYFKLGLYPRAIELYERLISQHPADPVLRLNLALVYFKTGQTSGARDELLEVVRLNPDYRKAYGYLGLAHERLGEYQAARAAFRKAGADHLATRMARFVEPDNSAEVDLPADSFPPPPPVDDRPAEDEPPAPAEILVRDGPERLSIPALQGFRIQPGGQLLVNVIERVMTRLSGLAFSSSDGLSRVLASSAQLPDQLTSTHDPLYEVRGDGRLGLAPGDAVFSTIDLDSGTAYLAAAAVFAYSAGLSCEAAALTGAASPLAHLQGSGTIVLRTATVPQQIPVEPGEGVSVAAAALLGWSGDLTAQAAANELFEDGATVIELVGAGRALVATAR